MNIIPGATNKKDWNGGMTLIERQAKKLVLNRLMKITFGKLKIVFENVVHESGSISEECDLQATIHVNHPQFFVDVAFGGEPGSGESYMNENWYTDDLTQLVRLMVRNREVLLNMNSKFAFLQKGLSRIAHKLNHNSLSNSKKNIGAHYDIGNDLFKLFLDPTMMYSSGIFNTPDMTMEQASKYKLDTICRRLEISENDHVIEIGTGWGSFALHAALNYGCKVTTTTISNEQYDFTANLIKQHKLEDKITLLKQDYRKLEGKFDKLVSIEMIEAVGYKYMNNYINKCSDLLKPTGSMLLQAITLQEQYHKRYIHSTDFIKRYIFPGGCLPCVSSISQAVQDHSDLNPFHMESFGDSYSRTLLEWRKSFFANIDKVRQLGYNNSFIKMWEYYLCYCEGGFAERSIDVKHLIFTKPLSRLTPIINQPKL